MNKKTIRKIPFLILCVILAASVLFGCTPATVQDISPSPSPAGAVTPIITTPPDLPEATAQVKTPKYVFLFIGDGMSDTQVIATQLCSGSQKDGVITPGDLNFTQFPVLGSTATFNAESFYPDSASNATAIACGQKTASGVIGMAADETTPFENIAELFKADGKKIGIVTSVTINHATPAAFYAHIASRGDYYDIALQMAESGFDYFGGGAVFEPEGSGGTSPGIDGALEDNGYLIARTNEKINDLNGDFGKVYAVSPVIQDSGSMPYRIDAESGDLTLADFVRKGIDVLDNDDGFFMMCESGKIDWACHANDAFSAFNEVKELDAAVEEAMDFADAHPDDTLILVTGDHETGGLTIGDASAGYTAALEIFNRQKMSYIAFSQLFSDMKSAVPALTLADIIPKIKENFGLIAPGDPDAADSSNAGFVMSDTEYSLLADAFNESMKPAGERTDTDETASLYGSYDPLTVTVTHIVGRKAGISWTSYNHTGASVPVYASGAGAEVFAGSYDNTDIFDKLVDICGL